MKSLQNVYVHSGNAILVVVDIQNEFCKPGGIGYHSERASVYHELISSVKGLIDRARNTSIPIIFIQSVRTLQEPEFTIFGVRPILKIGTWATEIVDELKPKKGDIIVQKFSHDPFFKTDLCDVLQKLVKEPTKHYAILTGGDTSVCYYHAVLGFHLRGYWTIVPVDSIFASTDYYNQFALELFSHRAYPNVFLSRSDLIEMSRMEQPACMAPVPGK